ncbi:Pfs, NACHT and ankyrin domain protein [Mycena floridula]|nr:Pfs, NACHT and ankyrin domain protein [Mycena floridula]
MNLHTSLLESLDKIGSYTRKLDPRTVQVVFFGRLASLQTIIQLVGAQVSDDDVLQALTMKLRNIAVNLNMQHLKWPFAAEDEGDILTAIAHIESRLGAAGPGSISLPVSAKHIALDPGLTTKKAAHPSGSSVHFNLDHTVTGNIDGPFLSNNNIHFDADPALRQRVDTLVGHAIDAETIKKREKFLNWISKLDFQATQNETFAKHAAGTGDWFLKQQKFVDWKDGKTRFLWCPGIPGAGKTILSSIIVEHLCSAILQPKIAVICIYSDYRRQEEQTPAQLLGSILKQLVQQHPVLSVHLLTLHKTCLSRGGHPSIAELFAALQTEVLLYSQVYIVVDALDESSENNQARELFFSTCPQGLWSLPDRVLCLITSRDIPSISQEFDNVPRISIQAHNKDLETYIRGRITTDKKLKRLVKEDMKLTAEIISQVILKAAGMFLQACLHLDALASQLNRNGLRKALASLPKGIMDSYDDAMARIRSQGREQYKLACQIFYWLAYAKEPLSIKQLQHAVAVSNDMTEMDPDAIVDVDLLTGICAGLIVIQETSGYYSYGYYRIIQLVHYTTQEYFQLKKQKWFPDIHSSMATTCLTYLSFDAFNSTNISLGLWTEYPLYQYANRHWKTHVKADEAATKHYVLKFLRKKTNVAYAAHRGSWPTRKTALILAWLGLDHTLELLLSQDPTHVTDTDTMGNTPLLYAAQYGHIDSVKVLLARNVNPNVSNKDQRTPLSYVAVQGRIDIVQLLLKKNADPNICNKDQCTPLYYAVYQGHINIVKVLLENNADPNIWDRDHCTPLYCAIYQGHINILKLLLENNADPNICDKDQCTPLYYAVHMGAIGMVRLLLEKNADPNICNKDQYTLLSYAAEQGHIDMVKLLLEKNADPNICDKDQCTPLYYATQHRPLYPGAQWGCVDIVKLLLENNADPNICDKDQCTPLYYAAHMGAIDIVELLLENNADPNICDKDQRTPLYYAAHQGHIDIFKLLLEKNADPNVCDKDQHTPLYYAARQGCINIVKLLLEKNADPNICDKDQYTLLSHATEQGHIEMVKLLLEKNADPNICNKDQYTLLSYAAEQGHIGIVKLLLEKNADPNICDKDQCTPLSYAALWGHIDIIKLLLENNADPNICDKDQCTPLSYAADRGRIDIVKLLLEKNADPNICNKDQCTPLSYAADQGRIDIVKLLLENNAGPNIWAKSGGGTQALWKKLQGKFSKA